MLQGIYTQNLWATYSDNDLVLQSAGALTPEQQAAKARDSAAAATAAHPQHGAAGAPLPLGQRRQPAAGALPADIAAANRESWAVGQRGAAAAAEAPAAAGGAAAEQQAAGAAADGKEDDEDYDDLFAELT